MPHWERNHLSGLGNSSSLFLRKATLLPPLAGASGSQELRTAAEEEAACSSHPLARHPGQTGHSSVWLRWICILPSPSSWAVGGEQQRALP